MHCSIIESEARMIKYTVRFYNVITGEYLDTMIGHLADIQAKRDRMEVVLGIIIQFKIQ